MGGLLPLLQVIYGIMLTILAMYERATYSTHKISFSSLLQAGILLFQISYEFFATEATATSLKRIHRIGVYLIPLFARTNFSSPEIELFISFTFRSPVKIVETARRCFILRIRDLKTFFDAAKSFLNVLIYFSKWFLSCAKVFIAEHGV